METRLVTEVKVYILTLNLMRGNSEDGEIVAISYEKEKLINWYMMQLAPAPFQEEGDPIFTCHGDSHVWRKTFNTGSQLEWFNPCSVSFEPSCFK